MLDLSLNCQQTLQLQNQPIVFEGIINLKSLLWHIQVAHFGKYYTQLLKLNSQIWELRYL